MAKKKKSSKSGSKSKRRNRVEIHHVGAPSADNGVMAGLKKLLPDATSERFLVGLLIGAGTAYVLSDERLRGQMIRYAVQSYGTIVGGLEELKEQVADIQAEIIAEQAPNS